MILRKCTTFDAYIYPLKTIASSLAKRLYKQLVLSRYAIDDPINACVLVAVLDSLDELDSLFYLKDREDAHVVYLLNGTLASNHSIRHYFSSDVL